MSGAGVASCADAYNRRPCMVGCVPVSDEDGVAKRMNDKIYLGSAREQEIE